MMLQCWHDSPGLRPSFSDLVSDLDRILGLCVSEVIVSYGQYTESAQQTTAILYLYIIASVMCDCVFPVTLYVSANKIFGKLTHGIS